MNQTNHIGKKDKENNIFNELNLEEKCFYLAYNELLNKQNERLKEKAWSNVAKKVDVDREELTRLIMQNNGMLEILVCFDPIDFGEQCCFISLFRDDVRLTPRHKISSNNKFRFKNITNSLVSDFFITFELFDKEMHLIETQQLLCQIEKEESEDTLEWIISSNIKSSHVSMRVKRPLNGYDPTLGNAENEDEIFLLEDVCLEESSTLHCTIYIDRLLPFLRVGDKTVYVTLYSGTSNTNIVSPRKIEYEDNDSDQWYFTFSINEEEWMDESIRIIIYCVDENFQPKMDELTTDIQSDLSSQASLKNSVLRYERSPDFLKRAVMRKVTERLEVDTNSDLSFTGSISGSSNVSKSRVNNIIVAGISISMYVRQNNSLVFINDGSHLIHLVEGNPFTPSGPPKIITTTSAVIHAQIKNVCQSSLIQEINKGVEDIQPEKLLSNLVLKKDLFEQVPKRDIQRHKEKIFSVLGSLFGEHEKYRVIDPTNILEKSLLDIYEILLKKLHRDHRSTSIDVWDRIMKMNLPIELLFNHFVRNLLLDIKNKSLIHSDFYIRSLCSLLERMISEELVEDNAVSKCLTILFKLSNQYLTIVEDVFYFVEVSIHIIPLICKIRTLDELLIQEVMLYLDILLTKSAESYQLMCCTTWIVLRTFSENSICASIVEKCISSIASSLKGYLHSSSWEQRIPGIVESTIVALLKSLCETSNYTHAREVIDFISDVLSSNCRMKGFISLWSLVYLGNIFASELDTERSILSNAALLSLQSLAGNIPVQNFSPTEQELELLLVSLLRFNNFYVLVLDCLAKISYLAEHQKYYEIRDRILISIIELMVKEMTRTSSSFSTTSEITPIVSNVGQSYAERETNYVHYLVGIPFVAILLRQYTTFHTLNLIFEALLMDFLSVAPIKTKDYSKEKLFQYLQVLKNILNLNLITKYSEILKLVVVNRELKEPPDLTYIIEDKEFVSDVENSLSALIAWITNNMGSIELVCQYIQTRGVLFETSNFHLNGPLTELETVRVNGRSNDTFNTEEPVLSEILNLLSYSPLNSRSRVTGVLIRLLLELHTQSENAIGLGYSLLLHAEFLSKSISTKISSNGESDSLALDPILKALETEKGLLKYCNLPLPKNSSSFEVYSDLLTNLLEEEGITCTEEYEETREKIDFHHCTEELLAFSNSLYMAGSIFLQGGVCTLSLSVFKRNIEIIDFLPLKKKKKCELLNQHYSQIAKVYADIGRGRELQTEWCRYFFLMAMKGTTHDRFVLRVRPGESMNSILHCISSLFPSFEISDSVGSESANLQRGTVVVSSIIPVGNRRISDCSFSLYSPVSFAQTPALSSDLIDTGTIVQEKQLTIDLGGLQRVHRLYKVAGIETSVVSQVDASINWLDHFIRGLTLVGGSTASFANIGTEKEELDCLKSSFLTLGGILDDVLSHRSIINLISIQELYDSFEATLSEAVRRKKAEVRAQWVKDRKFAQDTGFEIPPQPMDDNLIPPIPSFVTLDQKIKEISKLIRQSMDLYAQVAAERYGCSEDDHTSELRLKVSAILTRNY